MGQCVRIRSLEALDPANWGYLASSGGVVGKRRCQQMRFAREFGPEGSRQERCALTVSREVSDEQV